MTNLTTEELNDIASCIDWGEWKHSWHLPKTRYGYTDWYNTKTLEKCLDVLEGKLQLARAKIDRISPLVSSLCQVIRERKQREFNEAVECFADVLATEADDDE